VALADISDVQRVLKKTLLADDDAEQIAGWLESAESRILRYLRQDFSATASETAKFYDVREGDAVDLPVEGATVSAVRVFPGVAWADSVWILQQDVDYDVENGKTVRLRPNPFTTPFQGAWEKRTYNTWQRVEVDYTPVANVPQAVRDGVALYAAHLWQSSAAVISGVELEKIGDYEYRKARLSSSHPDFAQALPPEVLQLVRPFRRSRPLVT